MMDGALAPWLLAGIPLLGALVSLAFWSNPDRLKVSAIVWSIISLGMMIGLVAGAFVGLQYLLWETEHRPGWSSGSSRVYAGARSAGSRQPLVGAVLLLLYALARAGI